MNHLFTLKKQRNMPFHDLVQQHFQPEELQNADSKFKCNNGIMGFYTAAL
jgi:hypothetical protein